MNATVVCFTPVEACTDVLFPAIVAHDDSNAASVVGASECSEGIGLMDDINERGFIRPKTVGGDKGYHTAGFIGGYRERGIAPHTALVKDQRVEGLDGQTTKGRGSQSRLIIRRRIEEIFGWKKRSENFSKAGIEESSEAERAPKLSEQPTTSREWPD